ncbi:phage/plasmid primase, P4 family [Xylella fastidiosa]|uniref:DNA primase family protein n=2 Tax=Xylella fastidiosa TaxID=2371 RepID=UPI0012AE9D35|nr:phage/plasmid primase, P4 family [Xylella fastidiosa]MRT95428.1 DNA primase [Xylella fastidiosa subsp. multiplex]MRU35050.1 DNA primase [Xylella fastidiosa subsp. multiplex]QMT66230.1 DNA primase [Xylella fastidiosa subsp. multiplex]
MRDSITVLKHPVNTLAKTWCADGSVKAYDNAKFFQVEQRALNNSRELSALLTELEQNPHACVIRGAYVGDAKAAALDTEFQKGKVRRIAELYDDIPHHWMLVEIDNFEPLRRDPVADPVGSIGEFLHAHLPFGFHGADYHWQLSSSAGRPECAGKLKAHVWFWLNKPYTSAQLKAWAAVCAPGLDASVFNTVQIHYTAAPVFEAGVTDPVPVRSGFVEGILEDSVLLEIDAAILESAKTEGKPSRQHKLMAAAANDPVAVHLSHFWKVLSTGKEGQLFITCPFEAHHTQPSNPTSTVYYPAHTGGYANGAFVCQHAHCRNRTQIEFRQGVGYTEEELPPPGIEEMDVNMFGVPTTEHTPTDDMIISRLATTKELTTDKANGARIVKYYGKQLMLVAGDWYTWNGEYWKKGKAEAFQVIGEFPNAIRYEAEQAAQEKDDKKAALLYKWAKQSESTSRRNAAVEWASNHLTVGPHRLDNNPWLLNCANGTVDLRTGELSPHRREDCITRVVPLNYNPNAPAPVFKKTLERITCEEGQAHQPLSKFLQRWFGYCATGEVREQKFAVLYGDGANGKSTLLDLIMGVLGGYAGVAAPGLLIGNKSQQHPTAVADLFGRRMVTIHESGDGEALREDFVKRATGGDALKARYMYGELFEFQPTHKLQLLTNHKPVIKGQDSGIWRRIMLIPFKASFDAAEGEPTRSYRYLRDMGIAEKLAAEREGVLAWLVAGAVEWYKNGLNPPDIVLDASEEYQSEQDRVGQFIDEECETGAEYEEKLSTPMGGGLYPAYTQWCKASGVYTLSKTRFLDGLKRCVPGFKRRDVKETVGVGKRCNFVIIQGVRLLNADI